MAIYRNVSMSFWTDSKVVDDFTPEDRYFYLYLFTNPHTNLCGCYEISLKQAALETGYSQDSISNLIKRFSDVHNIIRYSKDTKEVLILNWSKYNWTASEKFRKPLFDQINKIKNIDFKSYLMTIYNGGDTVSIPYQYGTDTTDTVTDTITVQKEVENIFEHLWSMYPEKKGKGRISDADKKRIANIGVEHFTRAIDRYKAEIKASSFKHYQNGSTFFHSRYIDYLDENYEPSTERSNAPPVRAYNMNELERQLLQTN